MSDTTGTGTAATTPAVPSVRTRVFDPDAVDPGLIPFSTTGSAADSPTRGQHFPHIDRYEITDVLGRGGMGVVYKARQPGLDRTVALKMILAGELAGAEEVARFLTEAKAVAQLNHPNIVQIYETGEYHASSRGAPLPYFTLEYVGGGSLAGRLNRTPQPPAAAADFIRMLAEAVHYAHGQGVVHRDLKPTNILLAATDGAAASPLTLQPKIADFGLAKLADDPAGRTVTGRVLGTPSYMAPEQAAGLVKEIGPSADVYALGAILYEVLTGHPPFKGETPIDTLDLVRTEEPVSPRRLQPKVPRDLDTICLKCLRKAPGDRYPSAQALADDLKRFVEGRPILARPVGRPERFRRWCGRNPGVAALIGGIWFSLLSGIGTSTYFMVRAFDEAERTRQSEQQVREEKDRSNHRLYLAEFRGAYQKWKDGHLRQALQTLDELTPQTGDEDLRGFEWYYLRRLCEQCLRTLTGHNGGVNAVAYAPDGSRLASAGADGTIRLWDRTDRLPVQVIAAHTGSVNALTYSPDGRSLASVGDDGVVKVWSLTSPSRCAILAGHRGRVRGVAFASDGRTLATVGSDRTARLWDLSTGRATMLGSHDDVARGVTIAPDGKWVASVANDGTIKVWDATTRTPSQVLTGHAGPVTAVAFTPDGRRMTSVGFDHTVRVWDTTARPWRAAMTFAAHTAEVLAVAVSPDGAKLASAGSDRTIRVWDLTAAHDVLVLRGNHAAVTGLAFSPDGWQIASSGADGTVRLWDAYEPGDRLALRTSTTRSVLGVAVCADGRRIAGAGTDGTVTVWDAVSGLELSSHHGHDGIVNGVALVPQSSTVLSAGADGRVVAWDTVTGRPDRVVQHYSGPAYAVAVSTDGRTLASAGEPGRVVIQDVVSGQVIYDLSGGTAPVHALAFSPGGTQLAVIGQDHSLTVLDPGSGRKLPTPGEPEARVCVAYDRTGCWLAGGYNPRLWPVASRANGVALGAGQASTLCATFSPDGKRVVTAGMDKLVRIWDTSTGREVLALSGHAGAVRGAAFSPDGFRLVTVGDRQTNYIWDATPLSRDLRVVREAVSYARAMERKGVLPRDGHRFADGPTVLADDAREKLIELMTSIRR